jgi:hypothetical protein
MTGRYDAVALTLGSLKAWKVIGQTDSHREFSLPQFTARVYL